MNVHGSRFFKFCQFIFIVVFLAGTLFPAGSIVIAQDGTTDPGTGSTETAPVDDGTTTDPGGNPTDVAPTDEAPTDVAPTDEAPTEVVPTDEAPTEVVPTDAAPTEVVPTEPVPVETPAPVSTEAAPAEPTDGEATLADANSESTIVENLAEVVALLGEENLTLVDENGNPVSLASLDAATALTSGDPYYKLSDEYWTKVKVNNQWVYTQHKAVYAAYTQAASCSLSIDVTVECHANDANPIQSAISDTRYTGQLLHIEAGLYDNNDIIIGKSVLIRTTANVSVKTFTLNSGADVNWWGGGNESYGKDKYNNTLSRYFSASMAFVAPYVVVNTGAAIQDGVDLVQNDGTVQLKGGTFNETDVDINKSLTLQGNSGGTAAVTIIQATGNSHDVLLDIQSGDVTIKDLTLIGNNHSDAGIYIHEVNSLNLENLDISHMDNGITTASHSHSDDDQRNINLLNVYSHDNNDNGMNINEAHSVSISNSRFNENDDNGLVLGNIEYVDISQTGAYSNGDNGMTLYDLYQFILQNSTVEGNGDDGLNLDDVESVNLTNDIINYNDDNGLTLEDSDRVQISGTTFNHNDDNGATLRDVNEVDITDVSIFDHNDGDGLVLNDVDSGNVNHSYFSNNGDDGLELGDNTHNIDVNFNSVDFNSHDGIYLNDVSDSQISNNLIYSNVRNGLYINDSEDINVMQNAIYDNGFGEGDHLEFTHVERGAGVDVRYSDDVLIWANNIYQNAGGVYGLNYDTLTVNSNRIVGNVDYGVKNGASDYTDEDTLMYYSHPSFAEINAEYNWWGCNEGANQTGCDTTVGNVDSDPWLVFSLWTSTTQIAPFGVAGLDFSVDPSSGPMTPLDLWWLPEIPINLQNQGLGTLTFNGVEPAGVQELDVVPSWPFTFTSNGTPGLQVIEAQMDNALVNATIEITGGAGGPGGPGDGGPGFTPVVGAGGFGLIPVTGGQRVALGCAGPATLVLPNGNSVAFNKTLCLYDGMLTPEQTAGLPAGAPEGTTFVDGLTIGVLQGADAINPLTDGTSLTVSFVIPAGMEGQTFTIYHWDPTANSGAGGWVELPGVTVVDGKVEGTSSETGTFILVTK